MILSTTDYISRILCKLAEAFNLTTVCEKCIFGKLAKIVGLINIINVMTNNVCLLFFYDKLSDLCRTPVCVALSIYRCTCKTFPLIICIFG